MKAFTVMVSVAASAMVIGLAACKKEAKVDAIKPLEQSFATAAPEVKQEIQAVNNNLKAGNYIEAVRSMEPVLNQGRLTEDQKAAVATALKQVNQALAANPALDSKEMYEKRQKMFRAVYGR